MGGHEARRCRLGLTGCASRRCSAHSAAAAHAAASLGSSALHRCGCRRVWIAWLAHRLAAARAAFLVALFLLDRDDGRLVHAPELQTGGARQGDGNGGLGNEKHRRSGDQWELTHWNLLKVDIDAGQCGHSDAVQDWKSERRACAAFNSGNAKAIAATYASDAELLLLTDTIAKGREIEKFFYGLLKSGVKSHALKVVDAGGSDQIVYGTANWSATDKDGKSLGGLATHIFRTAKRRRV